MSQSKGLSSLRQHHNNKALGLGPLMLCSMYKFYFFVSQTKLAWRSLIIMTQGNATPNDSHSTDSIIRMKG